MTQAPKSFKIRNSFGRHSCTSARRHPLWSLSIWHQAIRFETLACDSDIKSLDAYGSSNYAPRSMRTLDNFRLPGLPLSRAFKKKVVPRSMHTQQLQTARSSTVERLLNCAPVERKIRQLSVSAVGPRNTPNVHMQMWTRRKREPSYSHAFSE